MRRRQAPKFLALLRANNISQVCRKWRQVALSTPRLWTSFALIHRFIESDATSPSLCQTCHSRHQELIKRSSFAPLDFIIYVRLGDDAQELAEEIESLLRILFDQRSRWEFVKIIYDSPLSRWFDVTLSNMPMLKHLQLECCSAPNCATRLDLARSAEVRTLNLQGNIKIVGLNRVSNLVGVHLLPSGSPFSSYPTLYDCFELLRRTPSLEILKHIAKAAIL